MATLSELQELLTELKSARTAIIVGGQSYTTRGGAKLERGDLQTINEIIKDTEQQIAILQANDGAGGLSHSQAAFSGGYR